MKDLEPLLQPVSEELRQKKKDVQKKNRLNMSKKIQKSYMDLKSYFSFSPFSLNLNSKKTYCSNHICKANELRLYPRRKQNSIWKGIVTPPRNTGKPKENKISSFAREKKVHFQNHELFFPCFTWAESRRAKCKYGFMILILKKNVQKVNINKFSQTLCVLLIFAFSDAQASFKFQKSVFIDVIFFFPKQFFINSTPLIS